MFKVKNNEQISYFQVTLNCENCSCNPFNFLLNCERSVGFDKEESQTQLLFKEEEEEEAAEVSFEVPSKYRWGNLLVNDIIPVELLDKWPKVLVSFQTFQTSSSFAIGIRAQKGEVSLTKFETFRFNLKNTLKFKFFVSNKISLKSFFFISLLTHSLTHSLRLFFLSLTLKSDSGLMPFDAGECIRSIKESNLFQHRIIRYLLFL